MKIQNSSVLLHHNNSCFNCINLELTLDSSLKFEVHISQLSETGYSHIQDTCHLHPGLNIKTTSTIATSVVHSKLDYCNTLHYNIHKALKSRFQSILKIHWPEVVTKLLKHYHISQKLKSLHWLKLTECNKYNNLILHSIHFIHLELNPPIRHLISLSYVC